MKEYQLIVIGAGPGGYVAALRAAKLGMTVAVVETARRAAPASIEDAYQQRRCSIPPRRIMPPQPAPALAYMLKVRVRI